MTCRLPLVGAAVLSFVFTSSGTVLAQTTRLLMSTADVRADMTMEYEGLLGEYRGGWGAAGLKGAEGLVGARVNGGVGLPGGEGGGVERADDVFSADRSGDGRKDALTWHSRFIRSISARCWRRAIFW